MKKAVIRVMRGAVLAGALTVLSLPALALTEDEWYHQFFAEMQTGEYQTALETLREGLDEHPDSDKLTTSYRMSLQVLSIQADRDGDYALAADCMDRAWELTPGDVNLTANYVAAHLNYGAFLAEQKEYDAALDEFEKVLAVQPENQTAVAGIVNVLNTQAVNLMEARRFIEAGALLRGSLSYNEAKAQTHFLLGQAYFQSDDYNLALTHLTRARALGLNVAGLDDLIARAKTAAETSSAQMTMDVGINFRVRFIGQVNPSVVTAMAGTLDQVYRDVTQTLGSPPPERLSVLVYGDEANYLTSAPDVPFWSGGVYDGKIRLRASQLSNDREALYAILAHETAHAVLYARAGNGLPLWMNEGLAQYIQYRRPLTLSDSLKSQLRTDVERGQWVPLANLAGSWNSLEAEDARRAYRESLAAVVYLTSRYGVLWIPAYLERVGRGEDADEALRAQTFVTVDLLENELPFWLRTQ